MIETRRVSELFADNWQRVRSLPGVRQAQPKRALADALPRAFLGFADLGFLILLGRRIGNRSIHVGWCRGSFGLGSKHRRLQSRLCLCSSHILPMLVDVSPPPPHPFPDLEAPLPGSGCSNPSTFSLPSHAR
jgi:hypothetical protein